MSTNAAYVESCEYISHNKSLEGRIFSQDILQKMKLKINRSSVQEEGVDEPVSPQSQYFASPELCLSILGVFESEVPIDDSSTLRLLEDVYLPINSRFSSIMVKDEHGKLKWKKVQVKIKDHVKLPIFSAGLEFYDDHVQKYLSKMAVDLLPEDRPLWEIHIIKYPTRHAEGIIVFKLHHSLGDGFSLMGALFHCVRRADDPSLPLTFPSNEKSQDKRCRFLRGVSNAFSMFINTVSDSWGISMSGVMKDSITSIRSGDVGIENRPINLSTITFSLSEIKKIKNNLKATVNDAITGIIFYGIQLYMQATGQVTKPEKVTALVLLNTRATRTYQSVKDMNRRDSKAPWGNHFAFLNVSVPTSHDPDKSDPLELIRRAKKIIEAKRNSLGVYLSAMMLELMGKLEGPEAVSRYVCRTLRSSSLTISNLIGPMEKFQILDHPCKSFHFMTVRVPQSLTITVVSYMGMVKVAIGVQRDFIDSQLLISCLEKSFEGMLEAAVGKRT